MEDDLRGVGGIDERAKDVSGPLNVYCLKGDARCSRCKETEKEGCYLERKGQGHLHCLTCAPNECHFRRVVIKEGAASAFTWEELTCVDAGSVDALTTAVTAPAAPANTTASLASRKRPHSAIADSTTQWEDFRPPPPNRPGHDVPSLVSEPASQVRTHVSGSPYAIRYPYTITNFDLIDQNTLPWTNDAFQNAGGWSDQDFVMSAINETYVTGVTSPAERYESVVNDLKYVSGDFGSDFSAIEPVFSPDVPKLTNLSLVPDAYIPKTPSSTIKRPPTPSVASSGDVAMPARCPNCKETLHTRSEFRKHMARHTRPFTCNVSNCPRSNDGFATRNDLDRHIASVHDTGHAYKMYKCVVPGCKDPDKAWSRKDNFKAHLKRMHPDVDTDAYLEKSVQDTDGSQKDA